MRTNDTYTTRTWGCETCQRESRVLGWNYDPAPLCCDQPMTLGSRGSTLQIITDDVPGGFTVENGFKTPQTFYSKSEHRRALSQHGLRIAERGEWKF
jgi:hypothetical protein